MVRIFIGAARLPAVAVGLSAVRRFARAAPIPAATEPRGGVGMFHSVTGLRASVPHPDARRASLPIPAVLADCRWLGHTDIKTHCLFFRGIHSVRFYLPVSVPRLAVPRIPSPHCMWGY